MGDNLFDDDYRDPKHGCLAWIVAIALTVLCCLFFGCKTQYIAGTDTERIVEVHHHDTTIITEADSASAMALLECDSAYNVVLRELTIEQGKRIVPTAKTERFAGDMNVGSKMQLRLDCKEDSLENIIAWQDSIIRTTTTQTIVKVEKQKDFIWYTGVAFIVIICLVFVWNVAKLVLKSYGVKI